MPRYQGFTLIEMLVVLAINSLLAAILLPVLSTARDRAHQATCQSNERQQWLALSMYAADNDNRIMSVTDNKAGERCRGCDRDPSHFIAWYDLLLPYSRSAAIYRCPSYSGPFPIPDGWGVLRRFISSTYTISDRVVGSLGGRLDILTAPANTMLLAENPAGVTWFNTWGINYGWTCADVLTMKGQDHLVQGIDGTAGWGGPAIRAQVIALAADGHVQALPIDNRNGGAEQWKGISCWDTSWGPY